MNFFQILSEIEKVDPEVYDRLDSRRRVFQHLAGVGRNLAAAAVPLALGSVLNKAYAQTTMAPSVMDVLKFALKLEHLEANFYNIGLGTPGQSLTAAQTALRGQFSATNLTSLEKIRTDENNHVKFLRDTLTAMNATGIPMPAVSEFDFTGGRGSAGGPFTGVFNNPVLFLAVAQSLEDTGVRAYKGGAPFLMSNKTVLEAALNIHSVEARHASRLRTMRRGGAMNNAASQTAAANPNTESARSGPTGSPKSWVSGQDGGGASPMQTAPIYGAGNPLAVPAMGTTAAMSIPTPNEANTTHGGANTTMTTSVANFPALAFSEAFDEPLDVATVSTIARTFTVASSMLF